MAPLVPRSVDLAGSEARISHHVSLTTAYWSSLSNTWILVPYSCGCKVYKSPFVLILNQIYSKEPTPSLGCDLDWEVLHFFPKSERAVKWGKGCKQGECNELNLVNYRNPVTNDNTRQNSTLVILFIYLYVTRSIYFKETTNRLCVHV